MKFSLPRYNKLELADNGVWCSANRDQSTGIDYSDGQGHEQRLNEILNKATDLRWDSSELEGLCNDWVMQYHLSPQRAQIISTMNFPDNASILEVGCGCGAISRHLGDRGFHVSSIEGSAVRAEIARKRCKELNNVQFVHANIRQLTLPKAEYSAVLFIGVLEYAGAFAAAGKNPEQEVKTILRQILPALKEDGVIIIAIENRLGFKYLAGAREDHYGVANIGLYNYPQYDDSLWERYGGIKTWDQNQWSDMLSDIGNLYQRWYFPFPDYKLPQALLSDTFIEDNPHSHNILNRLNSTDHRGSWSSLLEERNFWQSVAQANCLDHFANSFCLILGTTEKAADQYIDFNFVRFPSFSRKPEFRQITYMPITANTVLKQPWSYRVATNNQPSGPVRQNSQSTEYFSGNLLVDVWCQALECYATPTILLKLVTNYWEYLQRCFVNTTEAGLLLDALPFNIIASDDDQWHLIDTEWKWLGSLDPQFVLFRALLYFAVLEGQQLSFLHLLGITRVSDFVRHAMALVGINIEQHIDQWSQMEQEFMQQVLQPGRIKSISELLQQPLSTSNCPDSITCISVYWSDPDGNFSAANTISRDIDPRTEDLSISFLLPVTASNASQLRIDPADHRINQTESFFSIQNISLTIAKNKQTIELWPDHLAKIKQLAHGADKPDQNTIFSVTGIDPQLIFDLPATAKNTDSEQELELKISLQWLVSRGQQILNNKLRLENEMLGRQLREKQVALQEFPPE